MLICWSVYGDADRIASPNSSRHIAQCCAANRRLDCGSFQLEHGCAKRLHRAMGEVLEVSAAARMKNHGPLRDGRKLLASLHLLVAVSGKNLARAAGERASSA